jgi:serine/threonine protein kinase
VLRAFEQQQAHQPTRAAQVQDNPERSGATTTKDDAPMVTNDLGACEWFVWDLRRSALIDRGQLDQTVNDFLKKQPRAEAPALAEYLVQQGTLTAFQAERILNGKTAGLVLGPYVLLDAIGTGSMGQVFKANSKNDQQLYAVKVLPRRSMWNVRLARRQVRSFSQFQHPAVVPFVDVGTAGGLHYLVWPLAEGNTLESVVTQQGKLDAHTTAHIGVQVAQGMHAAHQNTIFHGLVKPSNIMLGGDNQARILDFGIGSLLVENDGESLVDTMSTANTLTSGLDCSSPESVMDPTNRTPAGDQYSLGCTLYFCLTGRVPFPEGSAVEKMMAHQSKEPTPISEYAADVPDGLVSVVTRLMAKQPESRYSGMDEVVEALEPFLGDIPAPAPAPVQTNTGGSAHRMNGLGNGNGGVSFGARPGGAGAATMARPGTGYAAPVQTPTPARPQPGFGSRASAPSLPPKPVARPFTAASAAPATLPPPGGQRGGLPGRASFQPANVVEQEVALSAAEYDPSSLPDPARVSAGWTAATGAQPERKKPAFGMMGVLAAALTVGVLVFMAVKILILDKQ